MLTEEQLQKIEAAERAATLGEWQRFNCGISSVRDGYVYSVADGNLDGELAIDDADATFVIGARVWVPQLLATVRELQAENAINLRLLVPMLVRRHGLNRAQEIIDVAHRGEVARD